MSNHKIQIKNLYYSYSNEYEAIKNISLIIDHSESVGIIGANGAGKSTLLMLLLGIIFPNKGEVLVGDVKLTKKTLPIIRKRLGMVFQNPEDQLFMSTVYDDVAFGPRNYNLSEEEVETRVLDALNSVGIYHLKDRAPFRLSGGEKRAASIATVLSMNPDVLIMDEPTEALDSKSRRRVINFLNSFNNTKIITSHDLDLVFECCNRVILIKKGEIVADGSPKEILTNALLLDDCGFELPLSLQNCPNCGGVKNIIYKSK